MVADGSVPHGNWITGNEDVWTVFMTLHAEGDHGFEQGFLDQTFSHCFMIHTYLGGDDNQDWPASAAAVFKTHPQLLGQVGV